MFISVILVNKILQRLYCCDFLCVAAYVLRSADLDIVAESEIQGPQCQSGGSAANFASIGAVVFQFRVTVEQKLTFETKFLMTNNYAKLNDRVIMCQIINFNPL
ncbi:hypothetical protein JTB14_007982 [Gonioctena quinquepunctata]|nr:hypothetical protein JTB14_007982 [Gonioctena quinquepunctata]